MSTAESPVSSPTFRRGLMPSGRADTARALQSSAYDADFDKVGKLRLGPAQCTNYPRPFDLHVRLATGLPLKGGHARSRGEVLAKLALARKNKWASCLHNGWRSAPAVHQCVPSSRKGSPKTGRYLL